MENLKKFCETIRLRRANADYTVTTCPLCSTNLKGYDRLQSHIFNDHHIVLPPFDDVDDIDGFISKVKALVVSADGTAYTCLNSGKIFGSLAELEAHLAASAVDGVTIATPAEDRQNDCRFWTWDAVPAMREYRFFTPDAADADDDAVEDAINSTTAGAFIPMGDDEMAAEGTRVVEEGCGSSKIECPYCVSTNGHAASYTRYENDDFTAHLLSAHRIANFGKMLNAFVKADGSRIDFHDQIRVINMIREKTDNGVTPFSNKALEENEDDASGMAATLLAEVEVVAGSSSSSATPAQLAQVYVVSPAEFDKLLASAPTEDYYLLPKRTNDSLITYLLHTDDDDEEDEAEENFPMVPTLQEVAANKGGNDNDSSDSDDE